MLWTPFPFLWPGQGGVGPPDTRLTSSTSVASNNNPANAGASITFTATITTSGSPTGTVTFFDGASSIGTGAVSGTTATLTTSALSIGAHSITAIYGGDALVQPSASSALSQTVLATPAVVIDKDATQSDPTSLSTILFTATFARAVTGFTASDVKFTGSTAGGTLAAAVAGGPAVYTITVSGMATTAGNVVVSLLAGAAFDAVDGSASLASTAIDNIVAWTLPVEKLLVAHDTLNQLVSSDPLKLTGIG